MRGYREPGFQDRTAAAKTAKEKALEQLRNKPPVDEAEQAERLEKRLAKEAAARDRREAILREREAEKTARREKAEQAAAAIAKVSAKPAALTEAERKAARDLRYAARKARK